MLLRVTAGVASAVLALAAVGGESMAAPSPQSVPATAQPASETDATGQAEPGGWGPASSLTGAARAAWVRCAAQLGVSFDQTVRVRRFGETRETTERILPLVRSGEKTITTTTPWIYDVDPEQKPLPGAYSVVVDADLKPAFTLRTTATRTLAYEQVDEEDTQYEGKPVRPLAVWRDVHVRYFNRVLKPYGREWREDMPVTLERFEVVCDP